MHKVEQGSEWLQRLRRCSGSGSCYQLLSLLSQETVHHKPASPPPHVVPDSYATLMDVDPAPCGSTGSATVSEPSSPTARGSTTASWHTTTDAEVRFCHQLII